MRNPAGASAPQAAQSENSYEFPPGYGAFRFISSDGIKFHIDPSLLVHASGFFKNNPDLITKRNNYDVDHYHPNPKDRKPLQLTVKENAEVLDAFLHHINPRKKKPDIDISTIADLLNSAHHFRVPSIIQWFQETALMRHTDVRNGQTKLSLVENYPLLVLALAYKYGLTECARVAMRELIICGGEKWREEELRGHIDGRLVLLCKQLRDERSHTYMNLIESLSQNNWSLFALKKSDSNCGDCSLFRVEWVQAMMSTVVDHPKWSAFQAAYEAAPKCGTVRHEHWPDYKRSTLQKWVQLNKPEEMEERLPEVPAWLEERLRQKGDHNIRVSLAT